MAGQDFVPLFLPGHAVTCLAGGAITAGQVVFVSAGTLTPGTPPLGTPVVSGGVPNSATVMPTVEATTGATAELCGVASNTVPTGGTLAVWFDGWHRTLNNGGASPSSPADYQATTAPSTATASSPLARVRRAADRSRPTTSDAAAEYLPDRPPSARPC